MMKLASNLSESSGADSSDSNNSLNNNRLLSEAEASSLAGVTIDTLRSYTQFSLLKPVIRNQKPFYRHTELTQLFNIGHQDPENQIESREIEDGQVGDRQDPKVPTLEKLLSPEEDNSSQINNNNSGDKNVSNNNLPAVRVEDVIIQNQALNTRLKSLEEERDWLRRRVEQLEERSAREQMLMLKEKETLREVINATLVRGSKTINFSFRDYVKKLALPFFGPTEK